jgi:anaerobic selenocysteine-containing dehydrogenase
VRDAIEATYPDIFKNFNQRMSTPGGFPKPLAARHRKWNTENGKANFVVPEALSASFQTDYDPNVLRLMTLRSNDQFNTTIYGYSDRFRGMNGTRMIVMMNTLDMQRLSIQNGEIVAMETEANDGVHRRMEGFEVINYNIPTGCVGAYYPECNALIPLWQHADESKVPAAKSVPIRVMKMTFTEQYPEPLLA